MNVNWIYVGISFIVGIGLLFGGVRPGRTIVAAQRIFFLACGLGVLCVVALPFVNARLFGDILDFGILVCGESALISLLIWRFPRFTKVLVDRDNWHTPTT